MPAWQVWWSGQTGSAGGVAGDRPVGMTHAGKIVIVEVGQAVAGAALGVDTPPGLVEQLPAPVRQGNFGRWQADDRHDHLRGPSNGS
jgi:hypothetical protein